MNVNKVLRSESIARSLTETRRSRQMKFMGHQQKRKNKEISIMLTFIRQEMQWKMKEREECMRED